MQITKKNYLIFFTYYICPFSFSLPLCLNSLSIHLCIYIYIYRSIYLLPPLFLSFCLSLSLFHPTLSLYLPRLHLFLKSSNGSLFLQLSRNKMNN